jgi:hypothetical protein
MKTIHNKYAAVLALLFMAALPAEAILYQYTDPQFGPDSVTVDTSTGLGWLNLNASTGLSYEQVLADTQPGGIFSGFRYATVPEIMNFYSSVGIPGPGYYPLSSPSIQALFSLVGSTSTLFGRPALAGISGTTSMDGLQSLQETPQIYQSGVGSTLEYLVSGPPRFFLLSINQTNADASLGSWLVTEAPEPSTTSIWLLAVTGLIGFRFLQRRQNAPALTGSGS